jgi:predicted CxxxxCH...CXXCH cytochrome family protein
VKKDKVFFVILAYLFLLFSSATVCFSASPSASFIADPASGALNAPGVVQFTDHSTAYPNWWLWQFGDGTFSIEQHPLHAYQKPGTYAVSLSVGNAEGLATAARDYIVQACASPERIKLESSGLLSGTIMGAYGVAVTAGDSIMLQAGTIAEDLNFNRDAAVALKGGHSCSFENLSLPTRIVGTLRISAGTVNTSNVILASQVDVLHEVCDGIDNDGDGQIDENLIPPPCWRQAGVCADSVQVCLGVSGWSGPDSSECYGQDYEVAETVCDGLDNDCDGQIDEGLGTDADGDGYTAIVSCTGSADDCRDNDSSVHPGAVEIYDDGIDQNCDGHDFATATDLECLGCHGWNTYYGIHAVDAAPDGTCVNCHAAPVSNIWGGHYGRTVRTAGNNMITGAIIGCPSCHNFDHDYYDSDAEDVVWPKVSAVRPNETCDSCHEDRAAAHATGTAHDNRFITSSCGQCHTSDTEVLGSPGTGTLVNQADVDMLHRSDCTLCHGYTGTKIEAAIVEQAIKDGLNGIQITCAVCHANHPAIDHSGIITTAGTQCGGSCHSDPPPLADPADPKVHDACTTCHDALWNLIGIAAGKSAPGNCNTCHGENFISIHPDTVDHSAIVQVDQTFCGSCHSNPPPLVDNDEPKVHNACSSCHDSNGDLISLAIGMSFSAGGDCVTCHGNAFRNHLHHDGAENKVSYDAELDTSQASEKGCEICHQDYDMVNGTTLGLSTWETILMEHDLDGIKDGSTNTCDNCHLYDGNGSPPLADVQNAIASGNPATCATCHTDKVPDVDHGVPSGGKHPGHLLMDNVGCATCHNTLSYPSFKSGTDADEDGLYNLAETDVCDICHQDGNNNPATGFKDGWSDPDFELACTSCHELPPDTGAHLTHHHGAGEGWTSREITFATSGYLTATVPASTLFLRVVIDPSFADFWNKQYSLNPKQVRFSYQDMTLPFKVEAWDAYNNEAVFIVQQPELSSAADLTIYLHYGDSISAALDFDNVFPATIKAYYPLDENCPPEDGGYLANLVDATYNLNEHNWGNTTTSVNGQGNGTARHFSDSASIQGLYSPAFNALDPYGAEEMIVAYSFKHPANSGVYEQILDFSKSGETYFNWSVYLNSGSIIQYSLIDTNTGGAIATNNGAVSNDSWERRLGFYNGDELYTNMRTYRDGSLAGSGSSTWSGFEQLYDTSEYRLSVGYAFASPGSHLKEGDVDSIVIIKGLAVTDDIAVFDNQNQLQTWVFWGALGTMAPPDAAPPPDVILEYGDLRITEDLLPGQVSSVNMIGCGNCHPMDPPLHGNGVWGDVELANIAAPAGSLKSLSANGSYEPTTGTCSNVYCHSGNSWTTDGDVPMPWPEAIDWDKNIDPLPRPLPDNITTVRIYKDVTWNGGETLTCDSCHDNPPQTSSVDNDGGAGDSHSWIDPNGAENLHAFNLGFEAIGCRTCHYDTVRAASVVEYDYPAIDRRTYHDVAVYDKSKHVNGSVDVIFDTDNNFTYVSDAYLTETTYDLSSASFDPAMMTCSNVTCHFQETKVTWGLPYRGYDPNLAAVECDRCHGYYDSHEWPGTPCGFCHEVHPAPE